MIRPFFPQTLMAALKQGLATAEAHPSTNQRRVFFMAIHGDPWPADGVVPHEIRSVPYGPAMPAYREGYEDEDLGEVEPPAKAPASHTPDYVARPIRGEVIGDNSGRLFERMPGHMRLLDRIIAGPAGELLELIATPRPSSEQAVARDAGIIDAEIEPEAPPECPGSAEPTSPAGQRRGVRALCVEPGLRRIVRLGEFRELLGPQLAHPERLRYFHQLPCFVQLLEATAPGALEALRGEIQRTDDLHTEPLTPRAAGLLGLGQVLARLPRIPRRLRREPGMVLPGDRFFTLRLVEDPTEDMEVAPAAAGEAPAPTFDVPRMSLPVSRGALRKSIPEQFNRPWEFQFTREQALYDMNVASRFAGPLHRLWRGVKQLLTGSGALRKWQTMLYGKSLDEQLWGVRPPPGSLERPAVREWARRMLELARYDPEEMSLEWEIYWRRKGV